MISFKPGVRCFGARPELVLALVALRDIYAKFGQDLVVTSIVDGAHSRSSLHYAGSAADLRLPTAGASAAVVDAAKQALGDDFDVVLENDHIHLEYQPKLPY